MAISTIGASALDSGVSQLGKNLIINGAMTLAQRGTNFTSVGASNAEYLLDRYYLRLRSGAPARWTVTQESSGGVSGTAKWMKVLCTTADTTLASGDGQAIQQSIEGFNCQPIVGSNGKVAAHAISFDVIGHADAGSSITFPAKFCVGVKTQDGTGRQYHHDVTIAAADTWERVSFVVPADGTATLDNDNGDAYRLTFGLYSQQQATADTWENGDADHYVTSATDNWADSTNNYIGFTHIQVEPGSVATDFEHEDIGVTQFKCDRYYQRYNYPTANKHIGYGWCNAVREMKWIHNLRAPMRSDANKTLSVSAVANFSIYDADGSTGGIGLNDTITIQDQHQSQVTILWRYTGGGTYTVGEPMYANVGANNAWMAFEDEL